MCVVLNSWALFLLSFWKVVQVLGAVPSIKADLIHLQLGDITDTLHIKSHFRTPTQWSSLWAVQTLPSPLYPVRPRANTDLHLAIWRWKKEELALPSSESKAEMEFFYPISFSSYHIRLSNTILCKAVSGTRMCTWWINQQISKKKKLLGL